MTWLARKGVNKATSKYLPPTTYKQDCWVLGNETFPTLKSATWENLQPGWSSRVANLASKMLIGGAPGQKRFWESINFITSFRFLTEAKIQSASA